MNKPAVELLSVLFSGLAIGWLAGLSESNLASAFLTAVLAFSTGGAVVTYALVRAAHPTVGGLRQVLGAVRPLFLALVGVGLAIGYPVGNYARANDWFGVSLDSFAERWGRDRKVGREYVDHLFESRYPKNVSIPLGPLPK